LGFFQKHTLELYDRFRQRFMDAYKEYKCFETASMLTQESQNSSRAHDSIFSMLTDTYGTSTYEEVQSEIKSEIEYYLEERQIMQGIDFDLLGEIE
jgi:hypothetical protein